MTEIRTDALAGWDSADEADRRAILDHAIGRAQRAMTAEVSGGMASEFRSPTLEVVGASLVAGTLVATIATSYRVYHYAQSGSDWSIQTVTITRASVRNGTVRELILYEDTTNLSEGQSDDHEDERAAREVVDLWLHKHAPLIDRAIAAAAPRASARSGSRAGGWPFDLYGSPDVELVEVRRVTVVTCTTNRIYFREQSGSDSFRVYAAVEETVLDGDGILVHTLFEGNTDRFSENEDHDDDAFTREIVGRWRAQI